MRKNYKVLKEIKCLTFKDKIIMYLFKDYSYKIYSAGAKSILLFLNNNDE